MTEEDPELEELKRQVPPGWYPDAHDPAQEQYWDGNRWTDARRPAEGTPADSGSPGKKAANPWPWVIGVVVAIIVIGAIGGGEDDDDDERSGGGSVERSSNNGGGSATADSPKQQVLDALDEVEGPVEDPKVSDVDYGSSSTTITVKTPGGGFEGASAQDIDWQVGAVLADLYGEGGYDGNAIVFFEGGLVDTRTGKDLPNARTATYSIRAKDAKQIDWGDEDAVQFGIDWSLYRTYLHPAIKND